MSGVYFASIKYAGNRIEYACIKNADFNTFRVQISGIRVHVCSDNRLWSRLLIKNSTRKGLTIL